MNESIVSQTVRGVKWNSIGTIVVNVLQMLKLFILARILSKSDFGLIAIALMIIGFADIFAGLGLASGLIHQQRVTREQYSSVFWVNLLLGVFFYLLLVLCSPFIADYYHQPLLTRVLPILGLVLVTSSFGKMFNVFKMKELDFKFISLVEITGVAAGFALTVILALRGCGVFSLVYGTLLQSLLIFGTYAMSGFRRYRILFRLRISEIKPLLRIGVFQFSTQTVDYAAGKLDVLIIGRFFSAEVLGVYNLSKELLQKIVQLISTIVTKVGSPAFARFQHDMPKMRDAYGRVLTVLASINMPVFFAIAVFADLLVPLLYGGAMVEMVWFVRIFSVWALFQSVFSSSDILVVSLGRTDLGFIWTLIRISLTLVVTVVACRFSIETMAWSQVFLAAAFFFAYWRLMVYRMIRMPLSHYLHAVAHPFLIAAASAFVAIPVVLLSYRISCGCWLRWGALALFGCAYLLLFWCTRRDYVRQIRSQLFCGRSSSK